MDADFGSVGGGRGGHRERKRDAGEHHSRRRLPLDRAEVRVDDGLHDRSPDVVPRARNASDEPFRRRVHVGLRRVLDLEQPAAIGALSGVSDGIRTQPSGRLCRAALSTRLRTSDASSDSSPMTSTECSSTSTRRTREVLRLYELADRDADDFVE